MKPHSADYIGLSVYLIRRHFYIAELSWRQIEELLGETGF